ncbi:M10 family metallopeptidase C-terminal domain-containing protein [Conchiformibius kuhniae]|uniref:M10 family metallopeptidase C-terminal domain-containing protein n=1 Tax=Conchiformibius kuhniae TaxID=211502 RepID=A0ABD8B6Q4_9NEIS|nr:hypothetical protein [Conchiformibius kuhniae]
MAAYTLKIVRNGTEKVLHTAAGKTLTVPVEYQTLYQITNPKGEFVPTPQTREQGMDLWVYLGRTAEGAPDVVLQNYLLNYPVVDMQQLAQMGGTFATAAPPEYSAAALASQVGAVHGKPAGVPLGLFGALGALGLAGLAAAASSGKKDGKDAASDPNPPPPTPPAPPPTPADTHVSKPVLTLEAPADINQSNQHQTPTLRGSLGNIDADVAAATLTLTHSVDGKPSSQTFTLPNPQQSAWTLPLNGSEWTAQGSRHIEVSVQVRDRAGNVAVSDKKSVDYHVDTVLSRPVVSVSALEPVSRTPGKTTQIEGTVAQVDADAVVQSVTVMVGGSPHSATVRGHAWTLTLDNAVLAEHTMLTATATVRDRAGNTATSAPAPQNYTVHHDYNINPPTITLDPVADINRANQNDNVTLRGKLTNIDTDISNVSVSVTVNGTRHAATVAPDRQSWHVHLNNRDLAAEQGERELSAHLNINDPSGNAAAASAPQHYRVDTVLNLPQVNIEPVGEVSRDEAAHTPVSVRVGALDADAQVETVSLNVNGKSVSATFDTASQLWTANLANADLLAQNPPQLSATVHIRDDAGNRDSVGAQRDYTLAPLNPPIPPAPTELTPPAVTVAPVADINKANAQQETVLRGTVSDIDAGAVRVGVTVYINGTSQTATLAPDQSTWTLSVPNSVLAQVQEAGRETGHIRVVAHVEDAQGKTVFSQDGAQSQTTYQVDTVLNLPQVNIEPVGEVSRDEAAHTPVSVRVGALDADAQVETVLLNVNGKSVSATFDTASQLWTANLANADLLAQNPPQLSATVHIRDDAGNRDSINAQRDYTLAPPPEPEIGIRITAIDGDNAVGSDRNPLLVRIKGRVNAESEPMFGKIQNREMLQSIELKINGKSYEAGLSKPAGASREYTFFADIPVEDLRAANGKLFAYAFHYADKGIYNIVSGKGYTLGGGRPLTEDFVTVRGKVQAANIARFKVNLDGEGLTALGSSYRVDADRLPAAVQAQVRGTVSGEAQAGDAVAISVNGNTHHTTVQNDKTFSITLPAAALRDNPDNSVRATLTAQRDGKTLTAQDEAAYVSGKPRDAAQGRAAAHEADPDALPYFIQNLRAEWEHDHHHGHTHTRPPVDVGYLHDHEAGTPIRVRYRFFGADDIANLDKQIRDTLDQWFKSPIGSHERFLLQHRVDELTALKNSSPTPFSAAAQAKMQSMLQHISDHAAVTFEHTPDAGEQADLIFHMKDTKDADGYAFFGSHVFLNKDSFSGRGFDGKEKFNFNTALHEVLHSLGMKHPHRDNEDLPDVPLMSANEDHKGLTVMSYNMEDFSEADSMRVFDLAYLHYRFGVNPEQRKGDDVYTFKAFNRRTIDNDVYIWDGGGIDTFDASNQERGVTVNLTPGSWIYTGGKTDQFAISAHTQLSDAQLTGQAGKTLFNGIGHHFYDNTFVSGQAFIGYGTQIENLIGSAHNDVLHGNRADNAIYGGAGTDVLSGDAGDDWLDGGAGADVMAGGSGNDTYIVGDAGDRVVELSAADGTDHVYSSIDYTLGAHLEHLTLLGNALNATGNGLANRLTGNSADNTLDGGAGADVLTGGAGKDTFAFTALLDGTVDEITDFTAGEDTIALSRQAFAALSDQASLARHIVYDKQSGVLSYDADGAEGNAPVAFAKIAANLDDVHQHMVLIA